VNHNHYAGLMEMLAPFALLRTLRQSLRVEKRALWGFAALLMVTSIFLSGSRGGMISISIEMVLIIVIFLALNRTRGQMIAAGVAVVLFLGFLFWFGSEQLASRVETLGHPLVSSSDRLQMAKDSWQMFKDRPLLGWGLGTFTVIYPHYSTFYSDDIVNAAHDDYVQFLVETGAVGFAAILWFLVSVFRAGIRNLRIWANRRASGVRVAAFLGVIGIVIHSFTDFNLQVPANAAMFFALCALVTTESTK
jgi:O-antigen ligase